MRLYLEELTQRILPSASPLPVVSVASPPPAPQVAAITSFVDSMVEQGVQEIAAIMQYASNVSNTLGQEIIQEVAFVQQQLDRFLGINPNTQNQSINVAASPSGSKSGLDRGNNSSSGSGSNALQQGGARMQPMAKSGGGVTSTTGGFGGFGSATVSGQVWLDNNGDGSEDDGESGLQGVTVALLDQGNVESPRQPTPAETINSRSTI